MLVVFKLRCKGTAILGCAQKNWRTNKNLQLLNNKAIASFLCAQVLKTDYFTQSEIAISTKKSYRFAAVVPNFCAVLCLKVRMPTAE